MMAKKTKSKIVKNKNGTFAKMTPLKNDWAQKNGNKQMKIKNGKIEK